MGGAIQAVEDDSSAEGDGESIAASEMDTDTVHISAEIMLANPVNFEQFILCRVNLPLRGLVYSMSSPSL